MTLELRYQVSIARIAVTATVATKPVDINVVSRFRILALSPFKITSDLDISVLVLNGSVSLRRSAEVKGRSITSCVPTRFRTVRLCGQAVLLPPPFGDIFIVIHPKWICLSNDDIAFVAVDTVHNNARKYAGVA